MRVLKTEDCFYVSGGGYDSDGIGGQASEGNGGGLSESSASAGGPSGTGCESPAAASARAAGYQACDALALGLEKTADLFDSDVGKKFAAEYAAACKLGVNNIVDAAYRTANYEACNTVGGVNSPSTGGESYGYYADRGGENGSN